MVQDADIDKSKRFLQGLGQGFVGMAGFSHTGRMVVGEYDPRRIVMQGAPDDLAWKYAGLGQGSAEQLLHGNDTVLGVQEQSHEDLDLAVLDGEPQEVPHGSRRTQIEA